MHRGIKLKQELKTLVVCASLYFIAVHLRGCDRLSGRQVKKLLKIKDIRFVSNEQLTSYGLATGIINPWNTSFCTHHLVCERVFYNRFMATNNSKYTEGVLFNPNILRDLPNVAIGNYSVTNQK